MRYLILLLFCGSSFFAEGQRYRLFLKDGTTCTSETFELAGEIFRNRQTVFLDNRRIPLDSVVKMENPHAVFEVLPFRRRQLAMGRVLEKGTVSLYDFPNPRRKRSKYYQRIHSLSRLGYYKTGDSVMRVLKRKNFNTVFEPSFRANYPGFEKLRKQYVWLHTTALTAYSLLSLGEVAVGIQNVAVLGVYTAVTTGTFLYSSIQSGKILRKLIEMVKTYNRLPAGQEQKK